MHFTQIIYCNNKPLILTDNAKQYLSEHATARDYEIFKDDVPENVIDALENLSQLEYNGAIIEHASLKAIIDELHKHYEPIDAGGGVVLNEHGELLLIYRRGKWDMAKGKRDKGETMEECALREVSEETGLTQLTLGEKVCDTYHLYNMYGKNQLKHTAWYHMQSTDKGPLVPQAEEDIQEAIWVKPLELKPFMGQTYQAIRDVLHSAGYTW